MENENYVSNSPEATNESPQSEAGKMALTDPEDVKVKFTQNNHNMDGRNGEAKVDIGKLQVPYAGMSKEELMKYANDPFWVRLRWGLFIFFWLVWAVMLATAIIIIVYADRCPPEPTADWYHKSPIYNIFPRSFKDSNGDGVGDIQGIVSKLDYLKEDIGVTTILLNSIYKSNNKDFGLDITNYTDVDPSLGTLEDFQELVAEVKKREMKLVLDIVPTHTSDEHEWFKKSARREPGFDDYYIWFEGAGFGSLPPNNWKSVYGGSAWSRNGDRGQFYQHDLMSFEPSLNLFSAAVQEEFERILRFWLDRGVDGFRVTSANRLFKDRSFRDEPPNPEARPDDEYDSLKHIYTTNLPEVLKLLAQWKELINNHTEQEGPYKILVTEVDDAPDVATSYYGSDSVRVADLPQNFQLLHVSDNSTGHDVTNLIKAWTNDIPKWASQTWVLGGSDRKRVGSRIDSELIDGMHMISMLVGGTPFTYYGEEIGMTDTNLTFGQIVDPVGIQVGKPLFKKVARDFERTPMQWSNSTNAGFTDGPVTWLPVNQHFSQVNVEFEQARKRSHLSIYKQLATLREQPAILFGKQDFPSDLNEDIFAVYRVKKGTPGFVVLVNFGRTKHSVDLMGTTGGMGYDMPEKGTVEVCSRNVPSTSDLNCDAARSKVTLSDIPLGPREAVVLKFVPSFP